ncbi:MAG: LysM peptidoglycan-binding domain-containing protein [Alphaproteobacteria bacterium]|nr:LysM peptidoglycan-binding domain-containing protein [Alphaproteobacteria bacterium]
MRRGWWWALLVAGPAWAGSAHVVQPGDTVESIAAALGDANLAAGIRAENGLGPGQQPAVGTVISLPDQVGAAACEPSYVVAHHGTGTLWFPGEPDGRPLADLEPLPLGARVCTDDQSFARVRLAMSADGTEADEVVLQPGSCITIRASHRVQGTRRTLLDLSQGSVSVAEEPKPGAVIVQTRAGVAVGDAGGFRVTVEADAGTRTEAIGASVRTLAAGAQVVLDEGFGNRILLGQAPGDPHLLPAPGTPQRPEADAPLVDAVFDWVPASEAVAYFLEVGRDRELSDPLMRINVLAGPWLPAQLRLPVVRKGLWWRVSTVDALGFEGVPSPSRRFTIPVVAAE